MTAELPSLSPVENLWHEMKEFIRREANPTTKQFGSGKQ
jgi:hypothetical protein